MWKFLVSITAIMVLSGCSAQLDTTMQDIAETASGRITEVKDRVQKAVEPVTEAVEDITKRVNNIKDGVDTIKEGSELIESGVSH